MPKKKYVVQREGSRKGDFEFNCANQTHICDSLKEAKNIIKSRKDPEENDDYDVYEAVVYEIILKKVKA